MKLDRITVHMMVKNEDRFIWYSIMSVLPYCSKILITDTGSTDKTISIIKSIKSEKIVLNMCHVKDVIEIARIRQSHIDMTETDWFWVVDGDEIYSRDLSEEILKIVRDNQNIEGIVVGRYDLLGDIYHYQNPFVGEYNMFGIRGHNALRLICKKNIPRLKVSGVYPYEGYYDKSGKELIHHNPKAFVFTKGKMWHSMYLNRSSLGGSLQSTFHRNKFKIEWGRDIPENSKYPEVFKDFHPSNVPNVDDKRDILYNILAVIITPIKMLKRVLLTS